MLKGETQDMGKMFEATMLKKYGPSELSQHFMVMDTICDATQARGGGTGAGVSAAAGAAAAGAGRPAGRRGRSARKHQGC
jgi:hypothetical protein